jgi:hypothetical protein
MCELKLSIFSQACRICKCAKTMSPLPTLRVDDSYFLQPSIVIDDYNSTHTLAIEDST